MESFLFNAFAALVVSAALAMVLSRNLVHSALFMAAAFLGMAFVYFLLQADYIAVVQILVYVGAISVLFVFGIMLTKRERMETSNPFNRYGLVATLAGLGFLALMVRAIATSSVTLATSSVTLATSGPPQSGGAAAISRLLLGDMALPFEAAALLLLAALAGAVVIGKGTGKRT